MHDRYGEARVLSARARSYAREARPDWKAALADLDEAVRLFEEMEARPALARAVFERSKALQALHRTAEAREAEARSLGLGGELGLKDPQFA